MTLELRTDRMTRVDLGPGTITESKCVSVFVSVFVHLFVYVCPYTHRGSVNHQFDRKTAKIITQFVLYSNYVYFVQSSI